MLAFDRALCADVLDVFIAALTRSMRRRAKRVLSLRSVDDALVGALTVIQRSDSALRVNPHFHTLALDGVYVRDAEGELVAGMLAGSLGSPRSPRTSWPFSAHEWWS